jgi:hypothetical protein
MDQKKDHFKTLLWFPSMIYLVMAWRKRLNLFFRQITKALIPEPILMSSLLSNF